VEVKGQQFHSGLVAFTELYDEQFRRDVLRTTPGPGGDSLRDGSLLPSSFYPASWYGAMLRAACALRPEAFNLAREVGRASAARDLKGIYRVVFSALSPETVIKRAPRLFKLFYSGGQVDLLELGPRSARVGYSACYGFDRNIWQDLQGGTEAVFQATGARALVLKAEQGGGDGDSFMVASVVWEE
jgi:hypothetical protein